MKSRASAAGVVAWLLAAFYYFYQYVLRSAPGVMVPQLSEAFGINTVAVASLIGLFYYGYAPFSLIAGTALDRFGAKTVVPLGALMAGSGALLFGTGDLAAANVGRFLQGAGGVFALVGAVDLVSRSFSPERGATLVGATQMFGSSGASVGQFVVGPMIAGGLAWSTFWMGLGVTGIALAAILFLLLPKPEAARAQDDWLLGSVRALGVVFRNPQSILCGLIAGLLFVPTTIFDMIWGVRFLQEAHGFDYGSAVFRSATIPLGWLIGCPLTGAISDRVGRRKPVLACSGAVLLACLGWILYGPPGLLPPYVLGIATGIASGAAMLPYTIVKEVNSPQFGGTATGVISFLNFAFSALLAPVFGWIMQTVSGGGPGGLEHYQTTFQPLLLGVGMAIVLTFFLKETGPAVRVPERVMEHV
jgi:MFS family permease